MIEKKKMKRTFVLERNGKRITLADPSSSMTPQDVMNFYQATYPELTTSTVKGPDYTDDSLVYTFVTTVGTKG